ncbi:MAG: putative damage-inducible protein DinB [Paraglaciecola sp.]|jgi:uncharacterized damage-inducible protein DinB
MSRSVTIENLLIAETKRRLFEEGIPRIKKCLAQLSEIDIWYHPNDNSNSVGNLVLHLCGNLRQWIITGLGHQQDTRMRDTEFKEKGPVSASILIDMLDKLILDVDAVLNNMTAEDFTKKHKVQVYQETGVSILMHVVEHFSYHVGQITYFTKWKKDIDTQYYSEDLG